MLVMSTPSRQKSWQTHRERVSVLAALAIQKDTVSRKLTELRAQHELSQERAAARVGVTMRQWQRWESGASLPYTRNLDAIAEVFGFPVSEFFDEDDAKAATSTRPAASQEQLDRMERKLDMILAAFGAIPAPDVETRPERVTVDPAPLVANPPAPDRKRRAQR